MSRIIIFTILIFNLTLFAGVTTIVNDTVGDVNDKSCIDRTFDMTSLATITDIMIEVNIDHTYRADLDLTLTSPNGTSVDLTSDNGGGSDNLYVKFDDTASVSVEDDSSDQPPVIQLKPEEPLSVFDAEDAQGTWTLEICDDARRDTGTFNRAVLEIDDTPPPPIDGGLQVNLQMDECYWLGGANGVTDDAKDSSGNGLHAQSRNEADNIEADAKICRAGNFINTYDDKSKSDALFYPNETISEENIGKDVPFSASAWVYRNDDDSWMAAVIKVSDDSWEDGWGLVHNYGSGKYLNFFVGDYDTYARIKLKTDTWTHVVGTYDGSTIKIYKNGTLKESVDQSDYVSGSLPLSVGDDISGSDIDDRWQGNIDEVKVWGRVLTDAEVSDIYNNENSGLNFDGTPRVCKSCNGSSIGANSWDLIGIPADSRNTPLSVEDVFADDMNGTYGDDWRLYKREYNTTNNSSNYKQLTLDDNLDFGQGYWLGSKLDSEWYVNNTPEVDYNSTNSDCVASECVEIDLTSVTHNFEEDEDDGTGPYRYNMSGYVSIKTPVQWADCRFIIDGTAYTPTDANLSGYASKQIWLYNGTGTNRSNSYTTCDDTMNCKLVPFKGFWVELHGPTKNKTVKLLIPKE